MIGHPVPVYVGPVAGGVQHDLAVRDLRPPVGLHEAAPYPEHDVRLLEEVEQGLGSRSDGRPQRQRVVLGKAALADHGREHWHLQHLGKLYEVVSGLRVQDPLAGVDDGALRLQEDIGDGLDVLRVGGRPVAGYGRVLELLFEVCFPYVERHLQQDGPSLARAEVVEGRPHQLRYASDLIDPGPPAGYAPVALHRVVLASVVGPLGAGAPGQKKQRNVVRVGLRGPGVRVLRARPVLHGEYAQTLPVGRAAEAVRDPHPDPLLPAHHGLDADLGARLYQGSVRERGQVLDTLTLQDLGDGGYRVHQCASISGLCALVPKDTPLFLHGQQYRPRVLLTPSTAGRWPCLPLPRRHPLSHENAPLPVVPAQGDL